MQRLKRCLAVLTASLLIFTSAPSSWAKAEDISISGQYTEADKSDFKFSYNFYRTIGVINEELNIDSTISRGSWADIVLRYFGWEAAIGSMKNVHFFADYDAKYDKIGAVNLAADLGFMGEYDDGKFCPEVDVSFEDVCVSVVKGLGYEKVVQSRGGSVEQYIVMASELGLLKGVNATKGYPITASAAMELLDNTLKAQTFGTVSGNGTEFAKGETVLSKVHNLQMYEGIVTANFRSSLYNSEKIPSNSIGIDNAVYNYFGNSDGLVGYRVRYFVDTTDNDTVVYLGRYKNEVEEIDFDDINRYEQRTYYYTLGSSTRERKWEIPEACAILYNGTAITDGFSSNMPMYTDNGSLTIIDNDLDGKADVLLIEAYTDMLIGHIDTTTETIYSYYDEDDYIKLNSFSYVELYDTYGAETTIKKLSVKDVLSLAKTPDGETIRIDVSTDTAEGKISGVGYDGDRAIITIDDIEYRVSSVCDVKDLKIGFGGVFYLNKKRQIVGYDEKLTEPVGYLVNGGIDDATGEKVFLKILTTSGEMVTFMCTDKVKVVGENKRYSAEELNKKLSDGGSSYKKQVVLYDVNDNGEIVSLDLVGSSERIRPWTTIKTSSVKYLTGGACFSDGKTFLNGGAVIFSVPMDGGEMDDYAVLSRSDLQNEREYSSDTLPLYTYQLDGSQLGVDVVVCDQSFKSRKYGLGIVKSIEQTIDENDEICHKVDIYQYANLNTYYLYSDDMDINNISAASSAFSARKLEEGDVVSLDYVPLSSKKTLSRLTIIYDLSEDEYLYSNPSTTSYMGVTRYFFGDVQTKDNKLMSVVLNGGTMMVDEETSVGKTVDRLASNYEIHPISGSVYMFDSSLRKDNVVKASANDIAAYDTVGDDYSKVWMFTSNESTQMIYIVNK